MYIATHCQQYTEADDDRAKCAEGRYGSYCVMLSNGQWKCYGCHQARIYARARAQSSILKKIKIEVWYAEKKQTVHKREI
jgi:hypothetical protein